MTAGTPPQLRATDSILATCDAGGDRDRVITILNQIDPVRARLLLRMAEALTSELTSTINPRSDFLDEPLSAAIGAQLLLHHATHDEKLNKKSFEYLLKYACEACGRTAILTENPVFPAADITIDGIGISLKTQADGSIKPHSAYIQKFMEARWIRDFSAGKDLANEAKRRISDHLTKYQQILMLRAFDLPNGNFKYELMEIPKSVLELINGTPSELFPNKNDYGSVGIDIGDAAGIAFRLMLDGSVEKVRLFNIRTNRCIQHGTWLIPSGVYIEAREPLGKQGELS